MNDLEELLERSDWCKTDDGLWVSKKYDRCVGVTFRWEFYLGFWGLSGDVEFRNLSGLHPPMSLLIENFIALANHRRLEKADDTEQFFSSLEKIANTFFTMELHSITKQSSTNIHAARLALVQYINSSIR